VLLLAAGVGCSSSAATGTGSSDGPGGPSDAGSERAAGDAPADLRSQPPDAAPDVPPAGIGNIDGVPCAAGVTCPSGLCGAGGHCLPKYQWSRTLPSGGCPTWMVVAPDGDLIVLGGAPGATLSSFIEKVDGDLNLVWRHNFGLIGGSTSVSIPQPAVLADGTVVFAVNGGEVMFDSGQVVLNSTADILTVLVALSSAGSYQWLKTYAQPLDATEDQISLGALAANPGGGMSVAGQLSGQVNLDFAGGAAGMESATSSTVFIAQYDVTGKLGLAKTYSSAQGSGSSITLAAGAGFTPFLGVAADGSMYLGGGFSGVGAFGSTTATYPGTQFIAHLGAGGSLTAAGSWVDTPPGVPPSLAMAADGSLFQSSSTAFARLDAATGQPQWSFPAPAWNVSHVAARANVVVVGDFDQAMDFDFGPGQALYQPQGPTDAPYPTSFMAGYDEAGQLQWVREPTLPTNNAVTIGLDGASYYVSVGTQSPTDLDPGPAVDPMLAPIGACYITKYAPP
jgi:hypothetical protein